MRNYYFLNNDFFDVTIYQYGYEQCEPFHTFGPTIRNHYLIHYIISGTGIYRTRIAQTDTDYHLHAGQAFLIEPNKIIHYTADEKTPWEYMWIEFGGLKAKEYINQAGLSQKNPIYNASTPEGSNNVYNYLNYIIDHPEAPAPEIMAYTYLFFNALIQSSSTAKPIPKNSIKAFYIQCTVDFIEKRFMECITVEDMAANLNLNRSYFSKLFKKMTQKSPQEFLITYRIHKSCEYLRSTNSPISEIALFVGYANQFHFTRAFKSVMDISPSEWRKQNRQL